jgi:ribonuclease VapC
MTLILDSPAITSVVCREQEHGRLIAALESASCLAVGAPTLAQAGTDIVAGHGLRGRAALALFLELCPIEVIAFDDRHRKVATSASIRFGEGRHPAALRDRDCMTYATAYLAGAPLLSVGKRFPLTDLPIAGE